MLGTSGSANTGTAVAATPAQIELVGLETRLEHDVVDRVFIDVSNDVSPEGISHHDGLFTSQTDPSEAGLSSLSQEELEIAGAAGILYRDGIRPNYALSDPTPPKDKRFVAAIAKARGEYRGNRDLFLAVLQELVTAGNKHGVVEVGDGPSFQVDDVNVADWASIAKSLADQGVDSTSLYLPAKVVAALPGVTGSIEEGTPPSTIDIDLPDLEDDSTVEIQQPNLYAMQALYFSAMLEEPRVYQVADKLVELFNAGVLPFGKGKGGDLLFDYWRKSNERFTEVERLNLYARCFGFPGGEPQQSPNREFQDLWLRFVSAVSAFFRQITVDSLLRSAIPAPVSQESIRKSGRDLAANLSLYGFGVAYFAATSLQEQIRDILDILQSDDVKSAYGARDMWQVVDQVASLELGGARNTVRYRTMAVTGSTIVRWLANHATDLSSFGNVIDETAVRRNIKSPKPMVSPTDRDLVDACEQWLAVTGTPDQQIEQYAQPVEAPNQTSLPIQIPQVAKDLLDSVGVSAGMNGR